ncbi:MAG: hypothetical protein L0Y56_20795 [Nitrospira sp.]|nr:hypothetical protein [Nitrospira sp.]
MKAVAMMTAAIFVVAFFLRGEQMLASVDGMKLFILIALAGLGFIVNRALRG